MNTVQLERTIPAGQGRGSNPFQIIFMYAANGNMRICGWYSDVVKYIKENYDQRNIPYIANYSYWMCGKCRGNIWLGSRSKEFKIFINCPNRERKKYEVEIYVGQNYKVLSRKFKRMPRIFLSEFTQYIRENV